MENAETLGSYEETLALYERLFRIEPELVAYDLHPEYLSTKFAQGARPAQGRRPAPPRAHRRRRRRALASASPSSGSPSTGRATGPTARSGAARSSSPTGRASSASATCCPCPMPGGAAAVRRPARMAYGLLAGIDSALLHHPGADRLMHVAVRGGARHPADDGGQAHQHAHDLVHGPTLRRGRGHRRRALRRALRGSGRHRARGDRRPGRPRAPTRSASTMRDGVRVARPAARCSRASSATSPPATPAGDRLDALPPRGRRGVGRRRRCSSRASAGSSTSRPPGGVFMNRILMAGIAERGARGRAHLHHAREAARQRRERQLRPGGRGVGEPRERRVGSTSRSRTSGA